MGFTAINVSDYFEEQERLKKENSERIKHERELNLKVYQKQKKNLELASIDEKKQLGQVLYSCYSEKLHPSANAIFDYVAKCISENSIYEQSITNLCLRDIEHGRSMNIYFLKVRNCILSHVEPAAITEKQPTNESTIEPDAITEKQPTNKYFESGQLQIERQFHENETIKFKKIYYENGQLHKEAHYNENGNKEWEKHYYENEQLHKEFQFYENGNPKLLKLYFENGWFDGEIQFYENGNRELSKWYEKNGELYAKTKYFENGNEDWTKTYYKNGQLQSEVNLNERGIIKWIKTYNEVGQRTN